jgi:hypothetical protein
MARMLPSGQENSIMQGAIFLDHLQAKGWINSKVFAIHYDTPGCDREVKYCSAIDLGGMEPLRILSENVADIKYVNLPWNQGVWAVNVTAFGFGMDL